MALSSVNSVLADNRIALVVNDDLITEQTLLEHSRLIAQQYPQKLPEALLRQRTITDLIDQTLKTQVSSQFSASDAEIDAAFSELAHRNRLSPNELKSLNKDSKLALYNKLKAQVLWQKYMHENVVQDIEITEEKIDQTLKELATHDTTDEIELGQIISQSASETAQIRQYFKAGVGDKNFELVAAKINTPALLEKQGYLGWMPRKSLSADIQKALKSKASGAVVGPLAMEGGKYQWLKVYRTRKAPKLVFEPVGMIQVATLKLNKKAVNSLKDIDDFAGWSLEKWADIEGATLKVDEKWLLAEDVPEFQEKPLKSMTLGLLETGQAKILIGRQKKTHPTLVAARERLKATMTANQAQIEERKRLRTFKAKAFIEIK